MCRNEYNPISMAEEQGMDADLNRNQIRRLAEALTACGCARTSADRDSLVNRLPERVRHRISRGASPKNDMEAIVTRCADFPEGIGELMAAVRFSDRGTIQFEAAENELRAIMDETKEISENRTPDARNEQPLQTPAKHQTAIWEKIAAFSFGVIFLGLMIGIAVAIPEPTRFQYKFFRVAMALAAAGIGAVVPGLLQVEINQKYMPMIRAGGAIALFVLVYLIDPPAM